jgi:hypothetical protein
VTWNTIGSAAASAGALTWTVTGPASADCLVRVAELVDGVPADGSDASFTVTGITVTAPNGGEAWKPGTSHDIEWLAVDVSDVKIELSRDDGAGWETIAASVPAISGSYSWIVVEPLSTDCRVRISDVAWPSTSDVSDSTFAISWFTDINAGLTGVFSCSLAWGDYDSDGHLDLALAGSDGSSGISKIYRNDAGTFTDIGAGLTGVFRCSLAWGDYDNDGDLDLALAGSWWDGSPHYEAKVYRNDGGTFTDIGAGLTGVSDCSLAWGDYDNDGDLDLALAGWDDRYSSCVSKIYRNDAGTFTAIGAGLTRVSECSLAWGDYDNDGDLDLALAGDDGSIRVSKIYLNDAGAFTDIGAGLAGVDDCFLIWGDYDSDGDLDLALAGTSGSGHISKIYRNDAGMFTDIGAGLTGVRSCSLAWGDFDNDGDLDLALAGYSSSSGNISKVYRNDAGTFTDIGTGLTGANECSLAWGDYDNDGDLDLAVAGYDWIHGASKIYRNDGGIFNTAPLAPTGPGATSVAAATDYDVTFSWAAPAVADETPDAGLSFNLRVGTTSGGNQIFSGMAQMDGRRKLPARGVVQPGLSVHEWTLNLPAGTYYWSVQAVDTALAGGAWAAEETVTVP